MATNINALNDVARPGRVVDLVRWGPVAAGSVVGLSFSAVVNALWLALASDTGDGWVRGNLGWFVGGTAAVALLLAGFLAGLFAGPRGRAAGLANGVTARGLLFLLSLTAVIAGAVSLTNDLSAGLQGSGTPLGGTLGQAGGGFTVEAALWTSFWSSSAGIVLAALGGSLGGSLRRPVIAAEAPRRDDRFTEASRADTTRTAENHVQRQPVEVVRTEVRR